MPRPPLTSPGTPAQLLAKLLRELGRGTSPTTPAQLPSNPQLAERLGWPSPSQISVGLRQLEAFGEITYTRQHRKHFRRVEFATGETLQGGAQARPKPQGQPSAQPKPSPTQNLLNLLLAHAEESSIMPTDAELGRALGISAAHAQSCLARLTAQGRVWKYSRQGHHGRLVVLGNGKQLRTALRPGIRPGAAPRSCA
jgi:hypothetical protein